MNCIALSIILSFANQLCTDNNTLLISAGLSNTPNELVVSCQKSNGGILTIHELGYFESNKCLFVRVNK